MEQGHVKPGQLCLSSQEFHVLEWQGISVPSFRDHDQFCLESGEVGGNSLAPSLGIRIIIDRKLKGLEGLVLEAPCVTI